MDNSELTPKILEQFKTESRENIEHAESSLLSLEKTGHVSSAIHEVFRSIHTIKGSADYLDLKDLKELSHAFEGVLDELRKEQLICISKGLADLFFEVLDALKILIEATTLSSTNNSHNYTYLIEQLTQIEAPRIGPIQKSSKDGPLLNIEEASSTKSTTIFLESVGQRRDALLQVKSKLLPGQPIDMDVRGMASRALQGIRNASQFIGEGELETLSGEFKNWVSSLDQCKEADELSLKLEQYLAKVQNVLNEMATLSQTNNLSQIIDKNTQRKSTSDQPITRSQTMRVDQGLLDGFMDLVGELIVARNAFSHIQNKLGGTEEARIVGLKELRESSNRLNHITEELERNVVEMRMVPVKTLFQKYPRIVRDICSRTGKSAAIIFEGEDTEIDKGIADQISEPLIHIVRNAIDHGIELTKDRRKSGKTDSGTLIMKASRKGNLIVIEVTDDGAGINIEKIKSKAVEKCLLSAEQAAISTNSELLDLIFSPGFSTADKITDISGRGVGLDIARTNLKKAKGTVSVSTSLNQSTCFRLEVPLTLAIMRALLIKADEAIYAISLQDVTETLKIPYAELKSICQEKVITLRGEVIQVEWLRKLIGGPLQIKPREDLRLSILILHVNGKRFGLIVDSVYRQEEIVVKPLPEPYSAMPGLAGASILGNGKTILILDTTELYSLANGSQRDSQPSNLIST
ncbi:MAG: chemotaxis protein CheA [Bdellovibrionia bacterium]